MQHHFSFFTLLCTGKCNIFLHTVAFTFAFDLADIYERTTLNTDDILKLIKMKAVYDCVIIKNIQEGICNIPIYVVMINNTENLYDIEDITNNNNDFSEWTTKRISLSDFINLNNDCIEKDGFLCKRLYKNFYVEDYLVPIPNKEFEIIRIFYFMTNYKKAKIRFSNINIYVKGVYKENGRYKSDLVNGNDIFETLNGIIAITGIPVELNNSFFILENASDY